MDAYTAWEYATAEAAEAADIITELAPRTVGALHAAPELAPLLDALQRLDALQVSLKTLEAALENASRNAEALAALATAARSRTGSADRRLQDVRRALATAGDY